MCGCSDVVKITQRIMSHNCCCWNSIYPIWINFFQSQHYHVFIILLILLCLRLYYVFGVKYTIQWWPFWSYQSPTRFDFTGGDWAPQNGDHFFVWIQAALTRFHTLFHCWSCINQPATSSKVEPGWIRWFIRYAKFTFGAP